MRIGQLADLLGIQTQTIRFYEKKGLLPLPARSYNGYRVYTEKHYKRLKFVCSCRAIGLSLSETVVFRILCHFVKLSKKEMTYDQNQFRHGCRFKAVA